MTYRPQLVSLCIPPSDSRKPDDLIVLIVLEDLRPACDYVLHPYAHDLGSQRLDWNQPRRPRHCLRSRQYAFGCKALRRSHANAKSLSGFYQTDHFSSIVSWGIFGKSKTFAQFADANGRPGLAISGFAAHSIERYGELAIGPVASEFPECI